jgi:hypothetical protein
VVKLETFPGGHNRWFMDENADDTINRLDQWFRAYYQGNSASGVQIPDVQKHLDSVGGTLEAPHQEGAQIQSNHLKDGTTSDESSKSPNDDKTKVEAGHPL